MEAGQCPCCAGKGAALGIRQQAIPANAVRVFTNSAAAKDAARGNLELYGCPSCGFVWNALFDPELVDYGPGYEATQIHSPTYSRFLVSQARELSASFGLEGAVLLEIGCGDGEFLAALCEAAGAIGLGFDPAFRAERSPQIGRGAYKVIAARFEEAGSLPRCDFVICRNTLEHIPDPLDFLVRLRSALAESPHATVFFQLPNWGDIVKRAGFEDIYYEHCSYFDEAALTRVFRRAGFEVKSCERTFAGQYLALVATLSVPDPEAPLEATFDKATKRLIAALQTWRDRIEEMTLSGRRVVLWGGGSKAVAFLSALDETDAIKAVIDINPNKDGTFLPASGLPVFAPNRLQEIKPDLVIVMNAVYRAEIADLISSEGLLTNLESL